MLDANKSSNLNLHNSQSLYYICHAKVILFCVNFQNKYIISILGELENLIEELAGQFPRSKEYRQKWEKRRTNLLGRWDEAAHSLF